MKQKVYREVQRTIGKHETDCEHGTQALPKGLMGRLNNLFVFGFVVFGCLKVKDGIVTKHTA